MPNEITHIIVEERDSPDEIDMQEYKIHFLVKTSFGGTVIAGSPFQSYEKTNDLLSLYLATLDEGVGVRRTRDLKETVRNIDKE